MKKLTIAVTLLMCSVAFVECKKSSSTSPDVFQTAGMHAKINNVAWAAEYINHSSVTGGGHYSLEFDGKDSATNESIHIVLPDFTGKGVRNITATSADQAYYTLDTSFVVPAVKVYATTGQVNITAINDSTASGTFNFTASDKTITDGTFNISF